MEAKTRTTAQKSKQLLCQRRHLYKKGRLSAEFGPDLRGLEVATGAQCADRVLKGGDGCTAAAGKWFNFLQENKKGKK